MRLDFGDLDLIFKVILALLNQILIKKKKKKKKACV